MRLIIIGIGLLAIGLYFGLGWLKMLGILAISIPLAIILLVFAFVAIVLLFAFVVTILALLFGDVDG